ncbi:hypothetical protein GS928_25085 [Rhodococcus hoagii]|nr:hypothetical protein [Prescottella equi]NKU15259.1 hypothetical protein [Prescottella equi]NKU16306.1 hypothetical protein [Prescottella equi]NKU16310.1 hypothetical protein [Prescottella equi]
MSDRDIIDDIDALVDEQMAGYRDRSGYDHNVNQDRCWHCGEDWHGLAITARMEEMRRRYRYRGMFSFGERDYAESALDPDYRYAEDDSEVLCPGSDFIGPWATRHQLEWIRTHRFRTDPPNPWMRLSDGPPMNIGRDFTVGGVIPPEEQFPPASFDEQLRRQREMIRRLAEFAAVPSATYQPMQRLVAGDRIVIESGGRRHEVVVLDVQQRGDRIEYTTADPRYSARAQQLASVRDRIRRGETPLPNDSTAAEYEEMLAANGFRIEHWQRDRLRELMSWPNPFDELADWESRMAARAAESMAELGRVAMRVQDAIQMAAATYSPGPAQTHWLSDEAWAAAVEPEAEQASGAMRECMVPARSSSRHAALLEALNTRGRTGESEPPAAYAPGGRIPTPETPQQRALPRPSTTPPMWAVDPTRTRRRRNR